MSIRSLSNVGRSAVVRLTVFFVCLCFVPALSYIVVPSKIAKFGLNRNTGRSRVLLFSEPEQEGMVMEGEGEVKGLTLAALAEEEEEAEAAGIQFADDYESDFESQANRMVVEGEEPDYDSMTEEEEVSIRSSRSRCS